MAHQKRSRRPGNVWVVVCDRARARIFSAHWPDMDACEEVETLVYPEGELHPRDAHSDAPGHMRGADLSRHEGEPVKDYQHLTADRFARSLAQRIEQGRLKNEFGRLVLVAPALFLGVLREALTVPASREVVAELAKELTHLDAPEISDRMRDLVSVPSSTGHTP